MVKLVWGTLDETIVRESPYSKTSQSLQFVTETKPEPRFLYFYSKTLYIKSHLNFNVLVSLLS